MAASAQTPPKAQPGTPATLGMTPPTAPEVTDPNKVVLTVGDEKITAAQWDQLVSALPAQYQKMAQGPQRRQIAEQIVQLKVLSKEAEARKLEDQPIVKQQLAFDRQNVLAGALYNDLVKNVAISDADYKAYFDAHKSEFESAKARHILIRFKGSQVPLRPGTKELTEEESLAKAQDIKKQLTGGADFATLAKAESDDVGSGVKGGDLGTFKHGMMVPQFEEAAFALPVGQVSDPVRTPFGYHLIQVQEKESKTLDAAKPDIAAKLRPELAKKQADDMRKKAGVTFDDAYFGPAAPMEKPQP